MNAVVQKEAIKIKLANHPEFEKAWGAFIKLGYHCPKDLVPHTAPYLYAHADDCIRADYFDVEGADLSSPKSALGYFTAEDNHKEITLAELLKLAYGNENAVFIGVKPEYIYYSVDADEQAYYTKTEPHISQRGEFWGKDITMKDAPNFKLHTDWKQSLIKRDSSEKQLSAGEVNKNDAPSLIEPLPSMRQALGDLLATKMGTVFYIPFLDANDPPKQFIEMLEDMDDCNLEALQEKSNAFKGLFDNSLKIKEVAENLICELQQSNYPYLLCVQTCQNIRSVHENEQGEIIGCGYTWNAHCSTWILTTELIDGVMQAKQIGDANLKRHKAKLDAELQPNV